jgi:hypothetical protein
MSQTDPWEKAAECTRAIETTRDPQIRQALTQLRTVWINLGNESQILSESFLADQIKTASQIHTDLMRPTHN